MIIRSNPPLRLGFADGGSDVSPYSGIYGGLGQDNRLHLDSFCGMSWLVLG